MLGMSIRLVSLCLGLSALASCAQDECSFNSQCGTGMFCSRGECSQNCILDTDCGSGGMCSTVGQCVSPVDGGADAAPDVRSPVDSGSQDASVRDASMPDVSAAPDMSIADAGPDGGPDSGLPGARFDPCTTGTECASMRCDVSRCTELCTNNNECADDELCAGGVCRRDDTGEMCAVSSAATCVLGLCLGDMSSGECTRPCDNAGDCPSGFACSEIGDARVCMLIETPCTGGGTECRSGLCLSPQGCTATCRTAADCPARATSLGVPPYTCEVIGGSAAPVCVPPSDILGSAPIGSSCPASGTNDCRSGLCNPGAPGGPMCTQTCVPDGCPPGFGCRPEEVDTGVFELLCARAGTRAVGESCSQAADCESALCNAPGYCSRLCADSLCPTGFRCDAIPTTTLRMCVREE
ncbi:MAG: hypothetical protein ACI9KE_001516 [Polyangiales bacterium]|jgi:hypothetical protein